MKDGRELAGLRKRLLNVIGARFNLEYGAELPEFGIRYMRTLNESKLHGIPLNRLTWEACEEALAEFADRSV